VARGSSSVVSDNLVLVSDEEIVLGRQIRFSLPSDEQAKNLTPEDILLPSVMK
jgi:hypothetical protein